MKAEEYLKQVEKKYRYFRKLEDDYRELEERSIPGGTQDDVRVQTSIRNRQEENIIRLDELNHKIDNAMYEYFLFKDEAINRIQEPDDIRHIKILYDHYITDSKGRVRTLKEISVEMGLSYRYASTLHREALKALEKNILQKSDENH